MPPPRERLVYDVTVESMFNRALKHRLTSRLKARVKEAGIDVDSRQKPSYPRDVWRLSQNFEYANNYNRSKLEEVGPGRFRLWVSEVGVSPHFIAGTVAAVLKIAGSTTPRVEIAEFDGQACTYAISS